MRGQSGQERGEQGLKSESGGPFLWTIMGTLAFTHSEWRSPWVVLSRRVTGSDSHFKRIILAAMLRVDCGEIG